MNVGMYCVEAYDCILCVNKYYKNPLHEFTYIEFLS